MIATNHFDKRKWTAGAAVFMAAGGLLLACATVAQQGPPGGPAPSANKDKKQEKPASRSAKKDAPKTQTPPKSDIKVIPLPGGSAATRQAPPAGGGPGPGGANPTAGQQTPPTGNNGAGPGAGETRSADLGGGGGRRGGLAPGGLVSMDFRGSDINNVLQFFAMATGWQVVPDPSLTGNVTIISPKQLTIDQAFEVLQASLQIRGFSGQFEKHGPTTILKIVPLNNAINGPTTILRPDGTSLSPDELKNQVVTQVIPIENVDAKALATELTPLVSKGATLVGSAGTNSLIVTDVAMNVQRINSLIDLLDKAANNSDMKMFSLAHSDATDVSNVINGLFRQVFNRGRGGGQPQPGQPGFQPGQPVQMGPNGQPIQAAAGGDRAAVVAVPDTRTNSIFIVASKDNMRRVADLIAQLDDPAAIALKTKFRKILYADAPTIADVVNGVLSGQNPTRSGASTAGFQQRIFGGGFGGFGGFGQQQQAGNVQSTDPFAKVVAEARTNSLIITATEERMATIDDLVDQLDVKVPVETTTFVVPLKNAHAEDIAYLLGQAFGTGTNSNQNNPFGFNIFGGFNNNNRNTNRNASQNRRLGSGTGSGFGRAVKMGYQQNGPTEDDVVPGIMTPNGFVPDPQQTPGTSSRAAQFGFFGGGGFGRQQQQTPQFGRNGTGGFVNYLQLRGNASVIADPNSNQVIVVTTPDNMTAIQKVIDQLDQIPRQVMIEVIIAEATLDATTSMGFQFDANGVGKILGSDITQTGSSNFPLGTAGNTAANIAAGINPGASYGISAMSGRFRALVQALGKDSRVKILSTPKVFASNNQNAEVDITTKIPYVTSATNSAFTGGQTLSYDFLPVGVILNVTPRVTPDKLVTIDVDAEESEFLGFDILSSTVNTNGSVTTQPAPRTSDRTTTTTVTVRDGEPVILGGLMRESKTINVNKVPLLSDIPILGQLFRSTTANKVKTELMVFLIPHVVDGNESNRALVDQQSKNVRQAFPDLESVAPALTPRDANGNPIVPAKPEQKEKKREQKQERTQAQPAPTNPAQPNDPPITR